MENDTINHTEWWCVECGRLFKASDYWPGFGLITIRWSLCPDCTEKIINETAERGDDDEET